MKSSISCTFDTVNQILTLSNCFTSFVPSGTEISFIIKNVRNPVSTQPVSDIQVYTVDDTTKQGTIDWAQGTLSVSVYGKITTSAVKPDSTLVQELT